MVRKCILVVEDDAGFARSLARVIGRFAEPLIASSASSAKALLARRPEWAGFLIDVGLPDGNGLDVLATFRSLHPDVPALVLTGYLDVTTVNRANDLHASYAVKTADHDQRVRRFVMEVTCPPPRVDRTLDAYATRCEIPQAELDVLRRYMRGESRIEIADARRTSMATVRKQIESLRHRTRSESLDALVVRILLDACRD
jgi:two-component system response regulator RegA